MLHMSKPSSRNSYVVFATTSLKTQLNVRHVKSHYAAIANITGFSKIQIRAHSVEIKVSSTVLIEWLEIYWAKYSLNVVIMIRAAQKSNHMRNYLRIKMSAQQ